MPNYKRLFQFKPFRWVQNYLQIENENSWNFQNPTFEEDLFLLRPEVDGIKLFLEEICKI